MRSADARRLNENGLFSFLALLSVLFTSQVASGVLLPLDYEATALPRSPWYAAQSFPRGD
jgi:hypothetical protein